MKNICFSLLFFILVNYHYTDAATAGNLFNSFGTVMGIDKNKNNPQNPFLNNNNNFRPAPGFNFNYGGTGTTNNKNDPFKYDSFKDPVKESDIKNKLVQGLELTEEEKVAAEKFPTLVTLLNRLKEMNRQKELQKRKENENNGSNNGGLPNNNGNIPNNNGGSNGNGNEGTESDGEDEIVPGAVKNRWVKLKKRKFFFQAQPVRPENEIVVEPEVVYYLV